ncbi:branched-chain amino acid ABC transporter permease [Haloplanus sp. GCM10025708]|uniref:branched-chain amino acid ABC transporter permease n=1 Tax=Haloplanus sp. GCM10025708 TaxID=3252679 RepID=UPI00361C0C12
MHRLLGLVALVALLLALPQVLNDYHVQVLFIVFLFIVLGYGWNILSGFTGYINFGYAGFVGLGAYVTVISVVDFGIPWYAALVIAGISTAIIGTLISAPILRLDGAYFAIAMLSLATAGQLAMSSDYLTPITRGGSGISFFPALSYTEQYYLAVVLAVGVGYATYRLAKSPADSDCWRSVRTNSSRRRSASRPRERNSP